MKLSQAIFLLLGLITTIHALALPVSFDALSESSKALVKRKGGGGGHASSGGGSGGGKPSGSSSSSSSGSSSGGTKGGSSSTRTGSSTHGSGPQPRTYGTGSYYGGGAHTPYRAGSNSPLGIAPRYYGAGGLAFFPGFWPYGAYAYAYPHPYTYHNDTSRTNQTHNAQCLCSKYESCGCDSNNDTDYINSVANNGSVSRLANVNGQQTLLINGTLPNGTTVASKSAAAPRGLAEMSGWLPVVAVVGYTVWLM